MADWVHNRVAVEGSKEGIAAFFAFDADSTPLLHHLPAPPEDELPMTATVIDDPSMSATDALRKAAAHAALVLGTEGAIRVAAQATGCSGWSPCRRNVPSDEMENPFICAVEDGRFRGFPAEERNIRRFGVPDGMSWRRLAWGSTRAECDFERDGTVLHFKSAWSGLLVGYCNVSRMFPSLTFRYLWYSDEVADCVAIGRSLLRAGKMLANRNESIQRSECVKDYDARNSVAQQNNEAGELACESLSRDMQSALEKIADVWWQRLCSEQAG